MNRDGLLDYPGSDVRYLPDEVIFTPGTRSGLAMVLEVLGADGTGSRRHPPERGNTTGSSTAQARRWSSCPTRAPAFLPDPAELDALLAKGGISSVIINNPHNPTGRVYPRELVEALDWRLRQTPGFVLYDSVYQRLDYIGAFVNPAYANPEWRDWVVTLSGLSKMDMFGASTGARACWMVMSRRDQDQRRARPRDHRQLVGLAGGEPVDPGPGLGPGRAAEPAGGAAAAVTLHARAARLHGAGRRRTEAAGHRAHRLRGHVLFAARLPRAWWARNSSACATAYVRPRW
jgi:hypothetical protein